MSYAAFGYLNSKYVFPSTTTNKSGPGEQPIDRHSLSRSISRKLGQLRVPKFVPHDLRRTVATRLGDADIGADPLVIEKILNHQLQGARGFIICRNIWKPEEKLWKSGEGRSLSSCKSEFFKLFNSYSIFSNISQFMSKNLFIICTVP